MLGPIVALLLLTSPASAPVDQLCSSDNAYTCYQQRQQQAQQQQIDDLQQQVDGPRQQERNRQWEQTYTAPPLTLPSSRDNSLFPSTSSSGGSCALCTSAGFR